MSSATGPPTPPMADHLAWMDEVVDAYVEWSLASIEVQEAYRRWSSGPRSHAPAAFAGYRMALDEEEAAADLLAILMPEPERIAPSPSRRPRR